MGLMDILFPKGAKSMEIPKNLGKDTAAAMALMTKAMMGVRKSFYASFKEVLSVTKKGLKDWEKKHKKALLVTQLFAKGIQAVGRFAMDSIGIFMQLADKMGILQPILDIFGAIFSIIGGAAMEEMGPALQEFAEVMFSDEMIEIWKELGTVIGDFLGNILGLITDLFSNPEFQKVLMAFIKIIENVFAVISAVLGAFFSLLAGMDAAAMGRLFYGIALMFAFMKGMTEGGVAGLVLGAIYAGIVAVALAPLLALQHGGIVTQPTIALIGEAGPEAVIPLGSTGGGASVPANDELLWATEDNGKRLDRLIGAMETSNRIKRLKYL